MHYLLKYWRLLYEQLDKQDKYHCRSVITMPADEWSGRRSKAMICLSRQLFYPLQTKFARHAEIGHALDHSWADVLKYMPDNMAKVVTVHDLIPRRYPGELSNSQLRRFSKRVSGIAAADLIVCVSNYTAREVQALLGISSEKIVVVPNGVTLPPKHIEPTRVRDVINWQPSRLRVGCLGSVQGEKRKEKRSKRRSLPV